MPPSLPLLLLLLVPVVSSGVLSAVSRSATRPDVLFPSTCPSPCSQLFRAQENSTFSPCACQCPAEAPVYLHTAGQCVEKLDECQTNVRFSSSNGSGEFLPIAVLPAKGGVLLPKRRILWAEAGVIESAAGSVECSVNAIFFDNAEHRWKAASRKLFALLPSHNHSAIVFRGSESEASQLTSSVVQLKLVCSGHPDDSLCLSFRVDGISGTPPGETRAVRWEIVLTCVCLTLLIALLVTFSVGFWCWHMEKKRLISRIRLQILSDYRRQQQTQQSAQRLDTSQPYFAPTLLPKRRLLFHAEFLERDLLENPPPIAEQFLTELRRMVDAAKERLRLRRFVPMLFTIMEMPEESPSPLPSRQGSPRSTRSVDSGRESREDSEGSEEPSSPRALRPSLLQLPSSLPPPPPVSSQPPPTRIPAPIGSASPRTAKRQLTTAPPNKRARKGYAVFPVDPMLNKSLPRRPKRTGIPVQTRPGG